MNERGRPVVVKLGGSYAFSALLRAWLRALEGARGVVLVPGGGPFADVVREAQPRMGFNDVAAHRMALLAMAQFAEAIATLGRGFVVVEQRTTIEGALEAGNVPVFCPWPMLRDAAEVPCSWDVTSDSLAVWLATVIDARAVVLIKHVNAAAGGEARGLLDAAFPAFRAQFGGEIFIAGPDDVPARFDPAHPPGQQLRRSVLV
jgi:5-(aminomethyl)-3-furanmethanol phosphate kinase